MSIEVAPVVLRSIEAEAPAKKERKPRTGFRKVFARISATLLVTMGLLFSGGIGATASSPAMAFDIFNPCGNASTTDRPMQQVWPGFLSSLTTPTLLNDFASMLHGPYGSANNATIYEWYGTAPVTAFYDGNWSELEQGGCSFFNAAFSTPTNLIHGISVMLGELGLLITSWALSADVVSTFVMGPGAPVPAVVEALRQSLYLDYFVPIVILSSLWIGWRGIVKRSASQAIQGTAWMFFAAAAATAFMLNPTGPAILLNDTVNQIGTVLVDTITTAATPTPNGKDMCSLPTNADSRGSRTSECALWRTFIYKPWAAAQFGPLATSSSSALQVQGNSALSTFRNYSELPFVFMDSYTINHDQALYLAGSGGSANTSAAKQTAQWNEVVRIMQTDAAKPGLPNFTGNNVAGRFSITLAGFIAELAGAFPTVFIALTIIYQQLVFVFLLLMAPIFLTIGIHPGMGRRMALGWLEMVLGTATKRVISFAIFAVMLGMIAAINSATTASNDFIIPSLLTIASSIAVLAYRKRLLDQASRINLGGTPMGGSEGQRAAGMTRGALLGAIAGAVTGHHEAEEGQRGRSILKGAAKGGFKGAKGGQGVGQTVSQIRGAKGNAEERRKATPGELEIAQLRREDASMTAGAATADDWAKWSTRNGGRSVPRPADAAMAAQLEALGVPLRERLAVPNKGDGSAETFEAVLAEIKGMRQDLRDGNGDGGFGSGGFGGGVPRPQEPNGNGGSGAARDDRNSGRNPAPAANPAPAPRVNVDVVVDRVGNVDVGVNNNGTPASGNVTRQASTGNGGSSSGAGRDVSSSTNGASSSAEGDVDWARVQAIRNNQQKRDRGNGEGPTRPGKGA